MKKWLPRGKWRIILPGILVVLVVGALVVPRLLVGYYLERAQERLKRDFNTELIIKDYSVKGITGLELQGLKLVPVGGGDTLLKAERIFVSFGWWSLLGGSPTPDRLEMEHASLMAWQVQGRDNLSRFFSKRKEEDSSNDDNGYSGRAYRLLHLLLHKLPAEVDLKDVRMHYTGGRDTARVYIPALLADDEVEGKVTLNEVEYTLKGSLDLRDEQLDVRIGCASPQVRSYPYLTRRFGLRLGFEQLHVVLAEGSLSSSEVSLKGDMEGRKVAVYQRKLNKDTTRIASASLHYELDITPHQLELDSASNLKVNDLQIVPYLRYYKEDTTREYEARVTLPTMPAQRLLKSLPEGTFESLQGMETEGRIGLRLDFLYTSHQPDTVEFDLSVRKDKFKITKFGKARLTALNDTFMYHPYGSSRTMRVGNSNPNFMVLGDISRYLINAVHYSEDGTLFYSNGFSIEAFKRSIIDNIKHGKFRRGGSTIPMQLVKNVFLSREKTVERKMEEAVLTWIIMQNGLVKPSRMLEVYLNIIEWGPEIYGAKEAARYYFDKEPEFLGLEESIFLAMLVPSPRSFYYFINDSTMSVDSLHAPYFDLMGRVLSRRKVITEEQADRIDYNKVKIKGGAAAYVRSVKGRLRSQTGQRLSSADTVRSMQPTPKPARQPIDPSKPRQAPRTSPAERPARTTPTERPARRPFGT